MKRAISILLVVFILALPIISLAEDAVEVGDVKADSMPAWTSGSESDISAKVIAEYQAQQTAGFDLGTPQDEIQGWNDVVVRQFFKNGDNKGNPWGWGATGYVGFIMYSEGASQAYTLKNEMLDAWAALGHFDSVGYPTSNQFEENGKIYQNFSKGYLVCDVDDSTTAELMTGTKEQAQSEATNPQTGDTGAAAYAIFALVGSAGAFLAAKKK